MDRWTPTLPEISREALAVVGGAIAAAAIMAMFPSLKAWIKKQWE